MLGPREMARVGLLKEFPGEAVAPPPLSIHAWGQGPLSPLLSHNYQYCLRLKLHSHETGACLLPYAAFVSCLVNTFDSSQDFRPREMGNNPKYGK